MGDSTIDEFLEKVYSEFENCVLSRGVWYKSRFYRNLSKLLEEYGFSKIDCLSIQSVVCRVCDQLVSEKAKERRIWFINFEDWKETVLKTIKENLGEWYLEQIFSDQQTLCSATQK